MATLLDADAVSRGENLGLLARMIVEGYKVGEHRSPFHGFAIEFAQHREYAPGDDIRHLDWKILGRSERYYIKQYEQDTNFVAHLLLDTSASMAYGRKGDVRKIDYAKGLAACLAYVILRQRDAVSLSIFDQRISSHVTRSDSPGKIHEILEVLARAEPSGETVFSKVLDETAARTRLRGIVVLISDLLGDDEAIRKGIEKLRFMGHEVIVFHVLDPDEIDFPLRGTVRFVGLEEATNLQTSPQDIRKSYLEAFKQYQAALRHHCERCNCHYTLTNTSVPLAEALSAYLAFRQRSRSR